MAKINYTEHQAEYLRQAAIKPRLTVREYCETVGINYNSARRHIRNAANSLKEPKPKPKVTKPKKPKKLKTNQKGRNWRVIYFQYLSEAIDCPSLTIAQFAALHDLPNSSIRREFPKFKNDPEFNEQCKNLKLAQIAHSEEKERAKTNFNLLKSKGKIKTVRNQGNAQQTDDQKNGITDHLAAQELPPQRDHLGRFLDGNRFNLVHGGYVKLTKMDDEIIQNIIQIDPLNLANEIITARSHYALMQRFLGLESEAIIERYENNEPILDFDGEPISLNKALADLEYSTSGKLRTAEASIANLSATAAKIQLDYAKVAIKNHETAVHSTHAELIIRQELMEKAESENWSAVQTAKACERHGINIPITILEEMKQEIASYEPEIDDDGLSDDELNRICDDYKEKQSIYVNEELPTRRKRLQKLIEEQELKENGGITTSNTDSEEVESEIDNDEDYDFDNISDFTSLLGGE